MGVLSVPCGWVFLTPATGDTIAVLAMSIEDKVKSLVVVGANTISSTGDKTAVSTDRDRSSVSKTYDAKLHVRLGLETHTQL